VRSDPQALVYPSEHSSFRYRPDAQSPWVTLTAAQSYGGSVAVNQGGDMEPARTEADANGTTEQSAWYYDAEGRRLIIKLVP
jgi:hypothetical protein